VSHGTRVRQVDVPHPAPLVAAVGAHSDQLRPEPFVSTPSTVPAPVDEAAVSAHHRLALRTDRGGLARLPPRERPVIDAKQRRVAVRATSAVISTPPFKPCAPDPTWF
jgi:hypothetical protein